MVWRAAWLGSIHQGLAECLLLVFPHGYGSAFHQVRTRKEALDSVLDARGGVQPSFAGAIRCVLTRVEVHLLDKCIELYLSLDQDSRQSCKETEVNQP